MRTASLPPYEDQRLARLHSLDLLDRPPQAAFQRVVRLAQRVSGAPTALVSLVDRNRQWFAARLGLDAEETPRDVAFCAHAILRRETLWVEDARRDLRFAENPLVLGGPRTRFYAGAPIQLTSGERIGTVCVLGPEPRRHDPGVDAALTDLAGLVADDCQLRLMRSATAVASGRLKLALDIADLGVWELSFATQKLRYHHLPKDLFDWRPGYDDVSGDLASIVHDEDKPAVQAAWDEHLRTGAPYRSEYRIKRRDGREVWVYSVAEVIRDEDGSVDRVVGVMQDVTERRLTMRALAEAREAAEAADAAKGAFMAEMSHELRTPLNGVLGVASVLRQSPLDEQQAEMVDVIERSAGVLDWFLKQGFGQFAQPQAERDAPTQLASFPSPDSVAPSSAAPRILLAEDHPVNRKVVEMILAPLGVDLVMVENGAEALEALAQARFDLVLMDINMPVMDGLTAMRRIRAEEAGAGRRLPILAVTANALPEQVRETLAAGADGHVAKPVTAAGLTAAVLTALDAPSAAVRAA